ncbi:hypothetical protein BU25DRAFT_352337 [Macroventuria anomochaeta]|uniref:Uncharacterized protein n=1 Tax=Macroventuria anomochaeta TaxID=301207 RepID=A0ACB6RKY3_9PLEO|nr:uncharacterized protein BU25DRAFT_352337 [Macroventuria anomochaeta]KAF2622367.1 hypothetical protein BU25DRAFT_352337 [Macroventuria anomochaeta]
MEHHGELDDNIAGPFFFDNDAAAYGVRSRNADDEVELMGEIPSCVLSAIMRYLDAMEGSSKSGWKFRLTQTDEQLALDQALLVLVADQKAFEGG